MISFLFQETFVKIFVNLQSAKTVIFHLLSIWDMSSWSKHYREFWSSRALTSSPKIDLLKKIYSLSCTPPYIIENNSSNCSVVSPSMVCHCDGSTLHQPGHTCLDRLQVNNILQMLVPQNWKQEVSRWTLIGCRCHGNAVFLHRY